MARSNEGILRRLRWPLLGILLVFIVGLLGYLALGFSAVDSLTNTILVLTTVGFSNRDPLDAAEKVFTDVVAILGVSAYLAMLALGAAALADGQFGQVSRRRRMERRIGRMRDHVIVCAYGRVGRSVARELESAQVSFCVIDRLDALEQRMRADGVVYLVDDPTSEEVLERAGISRARALISAVDSDADSVFIALTARAMKPDLFIVARGGQAAAADMLYRAGADRVISPYVSSGRHMAVLALRPRILDYIEIRAQDGTPLRLEEVRIDPGSVLAGKPLAEAAGGAVPLVLRRDGEVMTRPARETLLAENDMVVLLGAPESLRVVEDGTERNTSEHDAGLG